MWSYIDLQNNIDDKTINALPTGSLYTRELSAKLTEGLYLPVPYTKYHGDPP